MEIAVMPSLTGLHPATLTVRTAHPAGVHGFFLLARAHVLPGQQLRGKLADLKKGEAASGDTLQQGKDTTATGTVTDLTLLHLVHFSTILMLIRC